MSIEREEISQALVLGNRSLLIKALGIDGTDAWREACELVLDPKTTLAGGGDLQCLFVEFGHRIRERICDDQLMTSLLRRLLPLFQSEDRQLFRGENATRYQQKRIGFCWTPSHGVAVMFASGLNAMAGHGGLLLSSMVRGSAIIAGPNSHSRWLGEEEYWVSPTQLEQVIVLRTYPKWGA